MSFPLFLLFYLPISLVLGHSKASGTRSDEILTLLPSSQWPRYIFDVVMADGICLAFAPSPTLMQVTFLRNWKMKTNKDGAKVVKMDGSVSIRPTTLKLSIERSNLFWATG